MRNKQRGWVVDVICVCLLALGILAVRSYGIADPWLVSLRGFNGAVVGTIARNYLRFGLLSTRLAPLLFAGPAAPDELLRHAYLTHPPLRYLVQAAFFGVLGVHEWTTTLVSILFSLGCAIVLYILVRGLWSRWTAIMAVAFLVIMPMDAYYGPQAFGESMVLFFSLLGLLFYRMWLDRPSRASLVGVFVALGLGAFSGWATFYMIGLIGLHYLIFGPQGWRNWYLALGLWGFALLLFGAWIGYVWMMAGSLQSLVKNWNFRTGSGTGFRITFEAYYTLIYLRVREFFTPALRLLAALWAALFLLDLGRRRNLLEHSFVALLFLYGMGNLVVFRQASWVHEFWLFFFSPFFAVSAAVALREVSRRVLGDRKLLVAGLVTVVWLWYAPQAIAQLQSLHRPRDGREMQLARWLHDRTDFSEGVLVGFEVSQPYFDYYLDRRLAITQDMAEFKRRLEGGKYRFMALRSPRTVDERLVQTLVREYPAEALGDYLIFDLAGDGPRLVRQQAQPDHSTRTTGAPGLEILGYDGPAVVRLDGENQASWLRQYAHSTAEETRPTSGQFEVALYWRVGDGPVADLRPRLRLVGSDGAKRYVVDAKHDPVTATYSTGLWQPGDIVVTPYEFQVGNDLPPGLYTLEVVMNEPDDAVALGSIGVGQAAAPVLVSGLPLAAKPLAASFGNMVELVGYESGTDASVAGDTIAVRIYWKVKGPGAFRSATVCIKSGTYEMCRPAGLVGGPSAQPGGYYEQRVDLPLHPAVLAGKYDLVLRVGPDSWTDIPLGTVDIKGRAPVWRVAREGETDWEGSATLGPEQGLKIEYLLDEPGPVDLKAYWTGRAELARTRVELYRIGQGEPDEYLGTAEVAGGNPGQTAWHVDGALTHAGVNRLELRVAPEPDGIHNVGWRGVVDQVLPDLLKEAAPLWSGSLQVDAVDVERDWAPTWGAYRDVLGIYIKRQMWEEAAHVYQEAVKSGIHVEEVADLALLHEIGQHEPSDWLEGRIREEESRLIPNVVGIDLGGKIRVEGYGFVRDGMTLTGRLYLRCLEKMDTDWTLWLHSVPGDKNRLLGDDRGEGYVGADRQLETGKWQPGRLYEVDVSQETPPGRYEVKLGLWHPEDGSRLWRTDQPTEHEVTLGRLDL